MPETDDASIAMVAHGLLGSMALITTATYTLADPSTAPERRAQAAAVLLEQARHVSGVLSDLVLGLPAKALEALEHDLNERRDASNC